MTLNPNSAYAYAILGHTIRFSGIWEESIPEYKKSICLNPISLNQYLFGLGLAYCCAGQHDEAIRWGEKVVSQALYSFLAYLMLTVIYSLS